MRKYLATKYKIEDLRLGHMHDLPDEIHNAWTIIRHPASWLPSYFAYLSENNWRWEDRTDAMFDLLGFADGLFWPAFVEAVCSRPGVIGQVYDSFCVEGVKVYKLEHIDEIFNEPIPRLHPTENKPLFTLAQWEMICESEADTLERYGYDDTPPDGMR